MKSLKFILVLIFCYGLSRSSAQTASVYTGSKLMGTYTTIQAAVDAALPYDSIVFSADTFYEHHIACNRWYLPLVYQGTIKDGDTTVIDAENNCMFFYRIVGTIRNVIFQNLDTINSKCKNGSIPFLTFTKKVNLGGYISFRNNLLLETGLLTVDRIENAKIEFRNNKIINYGTLFPTSNIFCFNCSANFYNEKNSSISFRDNTLIGKINFITTRNSVNLSNIDIQNNIGGSGILIDCNYPVDTLSTVKLNNITIKNNQFNADYGGKAIKIIDSGKGNKTFVQLNNSYIYNPAPVGQKRVELYCDNSANLSFESSDTWWGSSDTAGLFAIKAPSTFKLHSWAKAHWYAVPYGKSPFTLTNVRADIRRSDGTAFADSSFSAMRGDFYASGGYFSPTSVAINPANVVASDYHLPATGPYSVMAVIDADTFKPSNEKLGIVEGAALSATTLSVAPNPFTERFKIYGEPKGQYRVQLLDISGKRIAQFEGSLTAVNADMAQQCSQLSSGAYLLNIEAPNAQKQQFKLVKQ